MSPWLSEVPHAPYLVRSVKSSLWTQNDRRDGFYGPNFINRDGIAGGSSTCASLKALVLLSSPETSHDSCAFRR